MALLVYQYIVHPQLKHKIRDDDDHYRYTPVPVWLYTIHIPYRCTTTTTVKVELDYCRSLGGVLGAIVFVVAKSSVLTWLIIKNDYSEDKACVALDPGSLTSRIYSESTCLVQFILIECELLCPLYAPWMIGMILVSISWARLWYSTATAVRSAFVSFIFESSFFQLMV